MRLTDIRFDDFDRLEVKPAWGHDDPELERHFYRHDGLFYKVWGPKFHVCDYVAVDGRFTTHEYRDRSSGIASIDVGLIDAETCPALVDLIWDDARLCRGYVLKEGRQFKHFNDVDPAFVETICRKSLDAGYAITDFCPKNMIQFDGVPSLIDIDTVPTRLDRLDIEVEREKGCLRPHIFPAYREFILMNCNRRFRPESAEIAIEQR